MPINPVTRAFHRYTLHFILCLLAYSAVLFASRFILLRGYVRTSPLSLQLLISASPVIPMAFLFAAFIRLLLHTDEYLRQQFVNSLAIAGGVTAFLAVAYGLIECDAVPHLSAWWTWTVFMGSWLISSLILRWCRHQ